MVTATWEGMQRSLVTLMILTTTSGCGAMSKNARTATVVVGVGMIAIGGVVVLRADDGADGPKPDPGYESYDIDLSLDDEERAHLIGGVLLIAGVVTLIAGAAARESAPPRAAITPPPAFVATPGTVAPPALTTPGGTLPALPAAGEVRRLALQAHRLAAQHHCAAAATVTDRIAIVDAAYAAALRADLVCLPAP